MKAKILLALDGSEPSMNATRYVANLFGNQPDVSVTLYHVFSPASPSPPHTGNLWISVEAKSELQRRKVSWADAEKAIESQIFEPARVIFKRAGFRDEQIETKCCVQRNESDVAHEILEECETGGYDTVVMGKRGLSRIRVFLTGSVTEKVVRHAKGHAVWIIE